MKSTINTFLFDLDGTLVNSEEARIEAIILVMKEYGVSISQKEILRNPKNLIYPWRILYRELESKIVSKKEIKALYYQCFRKTISTKVKAFNGISDIIEILQRKKFLMGIVTSLPKFYALKELTAANLNIFNCLIAYHDTMRHKPDPDPIIKALSELNSDNTKTIYIGDKTSDIESGKAAKVKTGAAFWGIPQYEKESLEKCHLILYTLLGIYPFKYKVKSLFNKKNKCSTLLVIGFIISLFAFISSFTIFSSTSSVIGSICLVIGIVGMTTSIIASVVVFIERDW